MLLGLGFIFYEAISPLESLGSGVKALGSGFSVEILRDFFASATLRDSTGNPKSMVEYNRNIPTRVLIFYDLPSWGSLLEVPSKVRSGLVLTTQFKAFSGTWGADSDAVEN